MWDATCSDTFAASNIQHAVREARAVAVEAEHRKRSKYQAQTHTHISHRSRQVLVVLRLFSLFRDIADSITSMTKDPSALFYLLQQVSVAIQRGNAAAVLGLGPSSFGYSYRPRN